MNIPVVAIADTNADPDHLTIPIAGNDDAIRSVQLITGALADEIEQARRERPEGSGEAGEQGAYTYSSDVGESEAAGARKKRPKRRPRPELIRRRRHPTDEEGDGAEAEGTEDSAPAADDTAAAEDGVEGAGEVKEKPAPATVAAEADPGEGEPEDSGEGDGSP